MKKEKPNLNKNLNQVFCNSHYKDTELLLKEIRKAIENGTSCTIAELKEKHSNEKLFLISLKYVTTTKKAICTALDIQIEGACRTKRKLEQKELLVQSTDKERCPITNYLAQIISTNKSLLDYLMKNNTNQLKLEI
jgi:hypothetical protein